ncbi:MAG: hypothetical protein V4459_08445 [Pseudomonadota bacterium]
MAGGVGGKAKAGAAKAKVRRRTPAAVHGAAVDEAKVYTEPFVLNPVKWKAYKSTAPLTWKHVDFNAASRVKVPKSPGLYAFAVQPPHADFPPSSWLFYVGEVGATGSEARTLWQRYKEYLVELDESIRAKVGSFIFRYNGFVRFYFCELDPKTADIKAIESELISALWPEGNIRDFNVGSAGTRRAFG